ncbi:hypothetical protein [Williamsia herbipolensis]|uniref:hypothetical protein n=1 Tax=Williamsia herbipolensis TaxID=1603258 RepID=UPI000695DA45|nr:hypothetical protein [Williamsia herbipolensis]
MSSDAEVADAVVAAATSVPGVTGLNSGRFGEVATYAAGRRIVGVRLQEFSGEVHIEVDLSRNVMDTAEGVRAATEKASGRTMTVIVEDVTVADPPAGEHAEHEDVPGAQDPSGLSAADGDR